MKLNCTIFLKVCIAKKKCNSSFLVYAPKDIEFEKFLKLCNKKILKNFCTM